MKHVHSVDFEIKGVTDIDYGKCAKFAEKWNTKAFNSLESMLGEVDAIDICTPPYAHKKNILEAADAGKHIMCEKPLIGYSPGEKEQDAFYGLSASKKDMLQSVKRSVAEIYHAVKKNHSVFAYFENFVYTPHVQKEAEIIRKTGAQILRMTGEEAHKGNHAAYSNQWKFAGGGSLISTGCHPLGGMLYLKRVEGITANRQAIRPKSVSARIHALTSQDTYRDAGFLRHDYKDVEDYAWAHVVFEDGNIGDMIAGATVLGGINDFVEVYANNHRAKLSINPVTLVEMYNPKGSQFDDIYINYGISTKEGWLKCALDENWMFGYEAEMQDALECFSAGNEPKASLELAIDTILTVYSAYLSAERGGKEVMVDRIE
jgi:predicted dehydrogenase